MLRGRFAPLLRRCADLCMPPGVDLAANDSLRAIGASCYTAPLYSPFGCLHSCAPLPWQTAFVCGISVVSRSTNSAASSAAAGLCPGSSRPSHHSGAGFCNVTAACAGRLAGEDAAQRRHRRESGHDPGVGLLGRTDTTDGALDRQLPGAHLIACPIPGATSMNL